jgi:SNF2 family DNA or RNA helicase
LRYVPRKYQLAIERHIIDHPCAAEFADAGLGKTAPTLSALARLIDRADIRAALVVAPLRVCQLTWPGEVAKWDHCRGMVVSKVLGSPSKRRAALNPGADLYLINYENLIWLTEWIGEHPKAVPFDCVVYDESSKMKNPSARRFRRMKPLLRMFHRNILLSGTPAPRAYLDLWSQFFLLDRGLRLESFVTRFRDNYFEQADWHGYEYKLRPGAAERIEARIADITLSLNLDENLEVPPLTVNRVDTPMPGNLMDKYKTLEKDLFVKIESLEVEAINVAALYGKCLQFTSGAIYAAAEFHPDGKPKPRTFEAVHAAKVDALRDIVEDAQGSPVLCAYWYKPELAILRKAFPKAPILAGSDDEVARVERAWTAGEVPLMFAHPASAGHGLNLQYGGHILVFATLPPFDAELYLQTVARLRRSGQAHPVVVHHLICPGTVDEASAASIATKDKSQQGLMRALRAYHANAINTTIA